VSYAAGDAALLVTQEPHSDALRVQRVTIDAAVERQDGQLIEIGGHNVVVDREGVGDHPGVTVLPIDEESAHQLVMGGGDEFLARLTTIDRNRPFIDRGDRGDRDR
jgi:hypothetical protein